MSDRPRAWPLVVAALGSAASCEPPLQSGGVVIMPGASERATAICRWRNADVDDVTFCGSEPPPLVPASVRRIEKDEDRLGGPLAIGRRGDLLLESGEIAVVVDQLGRGFGFAESGGNLVDIADARVRRDDLAQMFTFFGTFPRQAVYERLESGKAPDGRAWIDASGRELHDPSLAVRTRYELRPGERALRVITAVENGGAAPVTIGLGDAVQWGAATKMAPGKAPGFTGESAGDWLAAVGPNVAYLLRAADGAPLSALSGSAWSNAIYSRDVVIAPKARVIYERHVAVAPRGDALGVATELAFLEGQPPGGFELRLVDARGAEVAPPGGARVHLKRDDDPNVTTWFRVPAGGGGPIGAEIPAGKWTATLEGGGLRSLGAPARVAVEPGNVAALSISVSDAGALRVVVRERGKEGPCPAKIQVFDAGSNARVLDPILAPAGKAETPLPPGRYRVVASRGPEYTLGELAIDVAAGAPTAASIEIARAVDSTGYIGCDLHQHTALSGDSGTSVVERILSNVAEGVECAVASEHNHVVDLSPFVDKLGVGAFFRSIPGNELTSDASRAPFGHANVFPIAPDPGDSRGGALPVRDRLARDVFADARALPGDHLLQINHPRAGKNGYFDLLAFDPAAAKGSAAGYDERFDALEIWSGKHAKSNERVQLDFWALLRAGRPVTPTANTDTHGILGEESGYPRTYVAVPSDDPAALKPGDLVDAIARRRDVIMTNGPWVTMRIGDVRQGGLVSLARGKPLPSIHVVVERAPWVDVTELAILVGGGPAVTIPITGLRTEVAVKLTRTKLGKKSDLGPVVIERDTFLVATVRGDRSLEPVLSTDSRPFAMTAPIWIDGDGDGRSLNR